ncbi:MAG: hypothetical protein ACXW13_00080 [Burkholderiaceae bacterium]
MSRLSYGLKNAEQIETRSQVIRATEHARRALIARQITAENESRVSVADVVAYVLGAVLGAAFLAFLI